MREIGQVVWIDNSQSSDAHWIPVEVLDRWIVRIPHTDVETLIDLVLEGCWADPGTYWELLVKPHDGDQRWVKYWKDSDPNEARKECMTLRVR